MKFVTQVLNNLRQFAPCVVAAAVGIAVIRDIHRRNRTAG